jgi:hypothetical protein
MKSRSSYSPSNFTSSAQLVQSYENEADTSASINTFPYKLTYTITEAIAVIKIIITNLSESKCFPGSTFYYIKNNLLDELVYVARLPGSIDTIYLMNEVR